MSWKRLVRNSLFVNYLQYIVETICNNDDEPRRDIYARLENYLLKKPREICDVTR